jgi:hypothetical protein
MNAAKKMTRKARWIKTLELHGASQAAPKVAKASPRKARWIANLKMHGC